MPIDKSSQAYAAAVQAAKQYMANQAAQLSAAQARGTAAIKTVNLNSTGPNPVANVLASLPTPTVHTQSGKQSESELHKLLNGAKDGTSRLMSILSAGNYATANALYNANKDTDEHKYLDVVPDAIKGAVKGAKAGITGNKDGAMDFIQALNKSAKNEGKTVHKKTNAVAGFTADIILDPLNLVGLGEIGKAAKIGAEAGKAVGLIKDGGAVDRAVSKIGGKAAKKIAEETGLASKNAQDAQDAADLERLESTATEHQQKVSDLNEIAKRGVADAKNGAKPGFDLSNLVFNPATEPANNVAEVVEDAPRGELLHDVANNAPVVPVRTAGAKSTSVLAARSKLAEAEKAIEAARPAKYAADTEVAAPFKEVASTAKKLTPAQISGSSLKTAILSDPQRILKLPSGKSITVEALRHAAAQSEDNFKKASAVLDSNAREISKSPDELAKLENNVTVTNSKGAPVGNLTRTQLRDFLSTGKLEGHTSDDLANLYVQGNLRKGEQVSLADYVKRTNPTGAATKSVPLSGDELTSWIGTHADKLTPEELGKLHASSKTPAAFKSNLARFLAETKNGDDSAVDSGLLGARDSARADLERAQAIPDPALTEESVAGREASDVARADALDAAPTSKDAAESALADPSVLDKAKSVLTDSQASAVDESLKHFISRDLIEPLTEDGRYGAESKSGVKRTAAEINRGYGRSVRRFNEFSQGATLAKSIIEKAVALTPGLDKLAGPERGAAIRQVAMPMMHAAWDMLEKAGIRGVTGTTEKNGYALALPDLLDAVGTDFADKYFWDGSRQIYPSVMMKIGEAVIEHQALVKQGLVPNDIPKVIESAIRSPARSIEGRAKSISPIARADGPANKLDMDRAAGAAKKAGKQFNRAAATKRLIDARIAKAVAHLSDPETLNKIAEANAISAARMGVEAGQKVSSIQEHVIGTISNILIDPSRPAGDAVDAILDMAHSARTLGRSMRVDPELVDRAIAVSREDLKGLLTDSDDAAVGIVKRATSEYERHHVDSFGRPKNLTIRQARSVALNIRSSVVAATEKEIEPLLGTVLDLEDAAPARAMNTFNRAFEVLGRAFSTHFDAGDIRDAQWSAEGFASYHARRYNAIMSRAAKMALSDPEFGGANAKLRVQEIFKAVQRGTQLDDAAKPLYDTINLAVGTFDHVLENLGVEAEHVNNYLPRSGITGHFFEPWTKASMLDQLKSWDGIDDPLDFLSKLHHAVVQSGVDASVAHSLSALGEHGPGEGLVKLTDMGGHNSIFSMMDQSKYYPKFLAHQLKTVQMAKDMNATFAKADQVPFLKFFDKMTRAWKTGMTVVRPGYHARNLFSDSMLSFLDGVKDPSWYHRAVTMLHVHKGNISGDSELKFLSSLATDLPDDISGSKGVAMQVGKKKVTVDYDNLYKLAVQHGLFPGYQALAGTALGATKESGIPIVKHLVRAGGYLSEVESDMTRSAHFLYAVQNEASKIRTAGLSDKQILQLAAKRAADRVKKWHPDGSDMTGFEKGVMRRASMFYSWNRKTIPLMMEAALTRPGRVTVFPKAMYAVAMANGVDPVSLSDPFPDSQLFPDYITQAFTGPQFVGHDGAFLKIDPGDPATDTLSQWVTGTDSDGKPIAFRQALGTLNPWLRVPLELTINERLNTGGTIKDKSDYIDSNIPIVSSVAGISNHSITGLGAAKSGSILGYNNYGAAVADPNPGTNTTALLNLLTGAGVQNLSTPQEKKGGQLDLRDLAAKLAAKKASS